MIRRPPRSTPFPTRRSSDLGLALEPRRDAVSLKQPPITHQHGATAHGRLYAMASEDRKSTRLNSSHLVISYAVFCLKKKKKKDRLTPAIAADSVGCM